MGGGGGDGPWGDALREGSSRGSGEPKHRRLLRSAALAASQEPLTPQDCGVGGQDVRVERLEGVPAVRRGHGATAPEASRADWHCPGASWLRAG